jgi:predicted dehydrogenase
MKQTGVALLGVSHPHTSARLAVFRSLQHVRIVGAADADASLLAIFCNELAVPESNQDALLGDPDVHAVLIHAKSNDMVSLAIAALEAGKAVLVEKPGGAGPDDLQELASVVGRTGGVLQVGYNFHFAQSTRFADDVLARGLIGVVTLVRAHGGSCGDEHLSDHLNQPADIGGGLWVIGCHVVDLLVHHFGLPDAVSAHVAKFSSLSDAASREDVAAVSLLYPASVASVDFTCYDPMEWFESMTLEIWGTKGFLRIGPLPDRWQLYLDKERGGFSKGWTRWADSSFPRKWQGEPALFTVLPQIDNDVFFKREADAFIAAAHGDRPTEVSAEHALAVARLIDACYRSSAQHGTEVLLM